MIKKATLQDIRKLFECIIAYKEFHDGNSPSMDDLAIMLSVSKATIRDREKVLKGMSLLNRYGSRSRSLEIVGGKWEFTGDIDEVWMSAVGTSEDTE